MNNAGHSHTLRQRIVLSLVFFLAIVGTSAAQLWVASTGTVDEGSRNTIVFNGGVASLKPTIGSAIVRYNVLPVGTLIQPIAQPCCESRALMVRYRDNGPGARVIVTLKRYNIHTGEVTTLLTFDSKQTLLYPAPAAPELPLRLCLSRWKYCMLPDCRRWMQS